MPKLIKHHCQNWYRKTHENHPNHVYLKGKSFKFIVKTKVVKRFSRLRARTENKLKNIKTVTNIHPTIDEKSMQNLCSKSDAKKMETGAKMEPRGKPT